MALTRVTALEEASVDDLNQLIDALEGTAGFEVAYLLKSLAASDFKVRLADAAGARRFEIQDSAGTAQAYVDSDGNLTILGSFTPGSLVLPGATSPSLTTNNQVSVDTDDATLMVRIGGSNYTFYPGAAGVTLRGSSLAEVATTSTSLVDLLTISSLNIPVTSGIRIVGQYSRTGGAAANVGSLGFEINGTAISTPSATTGIALTTNTNQAEDGIFVVDIAARSTDYFNGWTGYYTCRVSSTGAAAVAGAFAVPGTANPIPNAAVSSVTITAINNTGNVNIAAANVKVYEVL